MNIVEQIHNEIDTAQERLLSEATRLLNANIADERAQNTSERLKKLGFVKSEIVRELAEKTTIREENANRAKLIEYYKNSYPFLKFLTMEEFDRICEKYDLVYAGVNRYVKNVPEKNISEIENAQPLRERDQIKIKYRFIIDYFSYVPQEVRDFFNAYEHDTNSDIDDRTLRDLCPIKYSGNYLYKVGGLTIETIDKTGLFIAAPKSHFDLDGASSDEDSGKRGFFDFKKIKPEPKDPIVFRHVVGGIQVLSKWGAEAEDPTLVNPITN